MKYSMSKKALITGITGQDGAYLAEILLDRGYEVHGLIRRITSGDSYLNRTSRINHIITKIQLHPASIENYPSVFNAILKIIPGEIYHLAAQSFVPESFRDEFSTLDININGTHNIINAVKEIVPESRFYFAASSEMFGNTQQAPQTETTPFYPRNPYGISKSAGYDIIRYYRESYNLFCCSGIAFNHESPRRGDEFITRKITSAVARIKSGKACMLKIGNLDAKRDWGFAGDYVEAMWLILQQEVPDDFVISTGEAHSIREFVETAFEYVGLNWKDYVVIDPEFARPAEVGLLLGDSSKARNKLKWQPKVKFAELVRMMVDYDVEILSENYNNDYN